MDLIDEQEISRRNKLIAQMIKINPDATIDDFAKVMQRLEEWEFKLPEIISICIWPELYTIGFRRWPPAQFIKTLEMTRDAWQRWESRDTKFHWLINKNRAI